mgnify:CR=1 FL=1|tara:strand:+ start:226 stop:456 length:231 start_codon:yes stop_codon:yes gene_type:complete
MKNKTIKLDLTGFKCPIPVLKVAKKVKEIEKGLILEIKADDPNFKSDLIELSKKLKLLILKEQNINKVVCFTVKKS